MLGSIALVLWSTPLLLGQKPLVTPAEITGLLKTPIKAKTLTFRGKTYKRESDGDKVDGFFFKVGDGEFGMNSFDRKTWGEVSLSIPGSLSLEDLGRKLGLSAGQKWEDVYGKVREDGKWVDGVRGKVALSVPNLDPSRSLYVDFQQSDGSGSPITMVFVEAVARARKRIATPKPESGTSVSLGRPMLITNDGASANLEGDLRTQEVLIGRPGTHPWSVQLYWSLPASASGGKYVLSFEAQSSTVAKIGLRADLEDAPYTNLGFSEDLELTPEWQRFSFEMTLSEAKGKFKLPVFLLSSPSKRIAVRSVLLRRLP